MKKGTFVLAAFFVLALSAVAISNPVKNLFVVNVQSCGETDLGVDFETRGSVSGSFWHRPPGSNQTTTFNGTFVDSCNRKSTTNPDDELLEGVCGSSVSRNLSNLAGVVTVDCNTHFNDSNDPSGGTCILGRCAREWGRICEFEYDFSSHVGNKITVNSHVTDSLGNKTEGSATYLVTKTKPRGGGGGGGGGNWRTEVLLRTSILPSEGNVSGNETIRIFAHGPVPLRNVSVSFNGSNWSAGWTGPSWRCGDDR